MIAHPDSTNKSACARDLNLSRTTVTKWWQQIEQTLVDKGSEYRYQDWLNDLESPLEGSVAREADPYEEELARLEQEILDSIKSEWKKNGDGEINVTVHLTDEKDAEHDEEADASILRWEIDTKHK